ncbi:hypothetical protein FQZ97_587040 [compost metagenome]
MPGTPSLSGLPLMRSNTSGPEGPVACATLKPGMSLVARWRLRRLNTRCSSG